MKEITCAFAYPFLSSIFRDLPPFLGLVSHTRQKQRQPTLVAARPSVWHQIDAELRSAFNTDEQYHWIHSGYLLAELLTRAGYSSRAQHEALQFFVKIVAASLGAAHSSWDSFMTDDHNPIELSWDWHTGSQSPTVRFSIEPVGRFAGTTADPGNQYAGPDFHQKLLTALPDLRLEWYDHFNQYFRGAGELEGHRSESFYAFDLGETGITSKAYFFPGRRARQNGQTNLEVIAEAVVMAPYCQDSDLTAFRAFQDFAHERCITEMDMLAIDLIDPLDSRIKIYFRHRATSFASVRDAITLGGRLHSATLTWGLQNLRQLWDDVLGQVGATEDASLPPVDHRTAGILYNVEFRPSSPTPIVKIYIPVRHYARSDHRIVNGVRDYLCAQNPRTERDMRGYVDTLGSVFTKSALQQRGLHTYLGCSVQPDGDLRVVSYLNPQEAKFA